MKLNFFNEASPLFDFRWLIVITLALSAFMVYHDLGGGRVFNVNQQQTWTSSGAGYHK
jgi:hypothetical protein